MARHFSGADKIICDPGTCGALAQGSYTMLWLYKIDLFAGVGALGSLYEGATQRRQGMVTSNKLFGTGDFSSGFPDTALAEDVWLWAAQSKDAGAAHIQWAWLAFADDPANTVFGEASDATNHGDSATAGDIVNIGVADVQGARAIALQAFFAPRLTDPQIQSAFSLALTDIMALSPRGCWPLNQADAADAVPDVTTNGADSNTVSGTTIVSDPPGYDFSLAPTVVDLVIASADQSQSAQNVTLSQTHELGIQSASQAQRATTVGNLIHDDGTVLGVVSNAAVLVGSVAVQTIALAGTIE